MRGMMGGDAGRRPADETGDRAADGAGAAATRADRIRLSVDAQLAPTLLELEDESARHAGHAGVRDGCGETHFALLVVSELFGGLGRVQRSRMVHEALAAEFAGGLHALSLTLRTPAEQSAGRTGDSSGAFHAEG